MTETFHRSLWLAISPALVPLDTATGEVRADVAIVGAGILGLSLALHLAERGVSVVLTDAEQPGFGASGRNTGFVVPSLSGGVGPSDLIKVLGHAATDKLTRFVGNSGKVVFDLIRRLSLECSAEQTGWIQAAHDSRTAAITADRVAQWQAHGQPVRLLDTRETKRATGSDRYLCALLDSTGGQINPLAYVRELTRAASNAGARIFIKSPVEDIAYNDGCWRLQLQNATITAEKVFATTNALVGSLLPKVRASLIPAQPYQVATQPLSQSVRDRIAPARQPVADLHRHVFAYRWSPDNRLVTGGLSMFNDSRAVDRMARYFLQRLRRYLPELPDLEAEFAWRGVVAVTDHHLPKIWNVGPGLYAPIGCNGRGIAVTTALGRALAEFVVTGERDALPVEVTAPTPNRWHKLLDYGPSIWLGWSRARDWAEDRAAERDRRHGASVKAPRQASAASDHSAVDAD